MRNLMLLLLLTFPVASIAQPSLHAFNDGVGAGFSPTVIPVDNDRFMFAGYAPYGFDSSVLKLVWSDSDFNVLNHKEYRLSRPLTYVFHAVKYPGGFLVGTLEYSSFGPGMSIVRLDTSGNVLRHDFTSNMPPYQEKFIQMVGNANGSFSAYTSASNLAPDLYRLEGHMNDTVLTANKIAPAIANDYLRTFAAVDINGNGEHILVGTQNDFATQDISALVMKLDGQQVLWARRYNFGLTEQAHDVVLLSNGNLAFVSQGYATGATYYDGLVTVVDSSGAHVWSKKMSIAGGGISPATVVETATGDLLVFGSTHDYKAAILKFSPTGELIWKKRATQINANAYFGNAERKPNGEILAVGSSGGFFVMRLDESGNGCAFEADTVIQVADQTPVVDAPTFTTTPAAVNFYHAPVSPRNLATTSTELCLGVDVQKPKTTTSDLVVFPNPVEDVCRLAYAGHQGVEYALTDLSGRTILNGSFVKTTTLSLANLQRGVYLLQYKSGQNEGTIKLVR